VDQSVRHWTPDFSLGHDLRVVGSWSLLEILSLRLPLPLPPPTPTRVFSLKKINFIDWLHIKAIEWLLYVFVLMY